jgi:hypothetical protein
MKIARSFVEQHRDRRSSLREGKRSAIDDKTADMFFLCHKSEILGACHKSLEEKLKQYCLGFDTSKI